MRRKPNETDQEYYPRYRAYMKDWRSRNKERELSKQREYRQKNIESIRSYTRAYRAANKERYSEYYRQYRKTESFKKWKNEWQRRQYETNENFRIRMVLSCRIKTALRRNGLRKCYKTEELLGCSVEFFKGYLEAKFKEGMTWDNQGKWHIDHVIPVVEFDLRDPSQQRQAFHYSNLQPLWAMENWSKGKRRIVPVSGE